MSTELLVKYMLGEADRGEQALAEQWLTADAAHQKELDELRLIWDSSRRLAAPAPPSEAEQWEKLKVKLQHRSAKKQAAFASFAAKTWWRAAAVAIVAVAGAGLYLYRNVGAGGADGALLLASEEKVKTATLPDGSTITLNKNTQIAYYNDSKKQRSVALKSGEAFFDVKPDKQKPFVVEASDATITVVGTSFNVKTGDSATVVIVESGVVRVGSGSSEVELRAHEKAVVRHAAVHKEANDDELYRFYRSHELIASSTPLWRVVELLNEAYEAQVELESSELGQLELTATFKNASLSNILDVVSETFDLEIDKGSKKTVLRQRY
jgi:ferric-dicitrate binding protein FerR (iron transport regulator)